MMDRLATMFPERPDFLSNESICRFALSEVELERGRIVAWIREAPARMLEQSKRGAHSVHPMYDAGQLFAADSIANAIEQGKIPSK